MSSIINKLIIWMKRRYLWRVAKLGPHYIVVWKPVQGKIGIPNSYDPPGWKPFCEKIKEYPNPRWWRLELGPKWEHRQHG